MNGTEKSVRGYSLKSERLLKKDPVDLRFAAMTLQELRSTVGRDGAIQ